MHSSQFEVVEYWFHMSILRSAFKISGSTYELDIRVHRRSGPGYQSSVAMMTITSDDQISSFFAIA